MLVAIGERNAAQRRTPTRDAYRCRAGEGAPAPSHNRKVAVNAGPRPGGRTRLRGGALRLPLNDGLAASTLGRLGMGVVAGRPTERQDFLSARTIAADTTHQ